MIDHTHRWKFSGTRRTSKAGRLPHFRIDQVEVRVRRLLGGAFPLNCDRGGQLGERQLHADGRLHFSHKFESGELRKVFDLMEATTLPSNSRNRGWEQRAAEDLRNGFMGLSCPGAGFARSPNWAGFSRPPKRSVAEGPPELMPELVLMDVCAVIVPRWHTQVTHDGCVSG